MNPARGGGRGRRRHDLAVHGALTRLARGAGAWRGVLTLSYHRFRPSCTPLPADPDAVTADAFDAQLRFLKRHFDVIGPRDVAAAVHGRRRGRRATLVTIDDGYRDVYDVALPVLAANDVPALLFVPTGFVDGVADAWWDELRWMVDHAMTPTLPPGRWLDRAASLDAHAREETVRRLHRTYAALPAADTDDFLDFVAAATGSGRHRQSADTWVSWRMVRELRAAGVEIGGHTVRHPVLARLTRPEQSDEVARCKARLEQELGEPMRWFAYPVGQRDSFDDRTREVLRTHGVELGFSCYGGYSSPRSWDPYDVRRATVGAGTTLERLAELTAVPQLFARW